MKDLYFDKVLGVGYFCHHKILSVLSKPIFAAKIYNLYAWKYV